MKDYSIKTKELRDVRKAKIDTFISKYGRGDKKLTEANKQGRIANILGSEIEKVKGFGKNKEKGVLFLKNPDDYRDFTNYPNDPYEIKKTGKSKVLNVEIRDDGTLIMEGIHLDGKENNPKERTTWGLISIDDDQAAKSEMKQFKEGILRTVSDRTMTIHRDNGDLDILLEDSKVNTEEDTITQY